MEFECYRVRIPEHSHLAGFTATGQRVPVLPGEHVVHRVKPKVPLRGISEMLRFIGADKRGRDVHIALPTEAAVESVLGALAPSAHQGSRQQARRGSPRLKMARTPRSGTRASRKGCASFDC